MRKYLIETLTLTFQGYVEAVVGWLWSLASPILREHPALLAAIPGLAEDRGAVYGSLAAKYSTMLYVGEAKTVLDLLKSKITYVGVVLGIIGGLYVILLSSVVSNPVDPFLYFLVSRGLILIVLVPVTAYLCYLAFLKGLDVDLTVISVVSVIADLLSALAIFLTFSIYGIPFVLVMLAATVYAVLKVGLKTALAHKREYAFSTILASTISTLAGLSLVGGGAQNAPDLLALAPLIMALNGSASMNFASWIGTMLALGEVEPNKPFNKKVIITMLRVTSEALLAVTLSLAPFALAFYGLRILAVALVTTLILRIFMPVIAIVLASRSFLKGWDPDLITIPILSSLNDLISANVLMFVYFTLR